jgi:septum formation inhibitor-activating ATPase MinD
MLGVEDVKEILSVTLLGVIPNPRQCSRHPTRACR